MINPKTLLNALKIVKKVFIGKRALKFKGRNIDYVAQISNLKKD